MTDEQLRAQILQTLDLADAPKEAQDKALYHLESIAKTRIALALPELLSAEQLAQVEVMRSNGDKEESILAWVDQQLPDYDNMLRLLIQDIADEVRS